MALAIVASFDLSWRWLRVSTTDSSTNALTDTATRLRPSRVTLDEHLLVRDVGLDRTKLKALGCDLLAFHRDCFGGGQLLLPLTPGRQQHEPLRARLTDEAGEPLVR